MVLIKFKRSEISRVSEKEEPIKKEPVKKETVKKETKKESPELPKTKPKKETKVKVNNDSKIDFPISKSKKEKEVNEEKPKISNSERMEKMRKGLEEYRKRKALEKEQGVKEKADLIRKDKSFRTSPEEKPKSKSTKKQVKEDIDYESDSSSGSSVDLGKFL